MKRLLTFLTVTSGIGCVFLCALFPISYYCRINSYDERNRKGIEDCSIGFGTRFRVAFGNGSVWFYNYEHPWLNGIRRMADEKGIIYKGGHAHEVQNYFGFGDYYGIGQQTLIGEKGEFVEKERDCQLPGFYYIHIHSADYSPPTWTLAINLLYVIGIFSILPSLWIYRRWRLRPNKK